jgi:hypothetical protein
MIRKNIKAGVVYARESQYGRPTPIVFLEDGAATLFQLAPYGRGEYRVYADQSARARHGRGWSDPSLGYAAMTGSDSIGKTAAGLLAEIDPAGELERFKAKASTPAGLSFTLVTSLNDISRTYAEAIAAYEAKQEADRADREREQAEDAALETRSDAVLAVLASAGIRARFDSRTGSIQMGLDEAEKLAALLTD